MGQLQLAIAALQALRLLTRFAAAHEMQQVLGGDSELFPRLNFSSPSPLIFHSTLGLLQQWPNTFFPAGHTIAPCTVAKHTNLYHARMGTSAPPSPEWFAFDAEMSYWIAGNMPDSHLLTYRTTRDVKCLYFDGTSASLMDDRSMLSQMLMIHNNSANVPDNSAFGPLPNQNGSYDLPICGPGWDGYENCTHWSPLQAEYDRADGLCNFILDKSLGGPGWGYEGIVRMNAAFELIWCNFSSPSAKLVSWLNISAPSLDGDDMLPWHAVTSAKHSRNGLSAPTLPAAHGARTNGSSRGPGWLVSISPFMSYSTYDAATKRYGFARSVPGRGEVRAKIDSCGLFTFYDPILADQENARMTQERRLYNLTAQGHWISPTDEADRQIALTKLTRRRRVQRALNVSVADGQYMREAVEHRMRAVLASSSQACSGIDWTLTTQEIVTFYGSHIYDLSLLLAASRNQLNDSELRSRVARVREVAHGLWMPYYEYPLFTKDRLEAAFSLWAPESQAALERCKMQYEPFDLGELSSGELTACNAVSEVLATICSTLLPVFLSTESIWLQHFNNASAILPAPSSPFYINITLDVYRNGRNIEELMAWLGWADQWTTCSPGCGMGQVCYIPIWPVLGLAGRGGGQPRNDTGDDHGYDYGYGYGRYTPRRRRGWNMDALGKFLWEPRCVDVEHFPPE